MAVTGVGSWKMTPAPLNKRWRLTILISQAQEEQVNWAQQYLPDLMEKEAESIR